MVSTIFDVKYDFYWFLHKFKSALTMGVRRAGGKMGICHPLEIGSKKKKFLENVKSAV